MLDTDIVKDQKFEEVTEVKIDSKNRIALGKSIKLGKVSSYKIYSNAIGQIILDPQVSIPAYEQWLFKNKKAAKMVRAGLEDARKGNLVDAPEDYSKHMND
jgi:predicted neuraminidase